MGTCLAGYMPGWHCVENMVLYYEGSNPKLYILTFITIRTNDTKPKPFNCTGGVWWYN